VKPFQELTFIEVIFDSVPHPLQLLLSSLALKVLQMKGSVQLNFCSEHFTEIFWSLTSIHGIVEAEQPNLPFDIQESVLSLIFQPITSSPSLQTKKKKKNKTTNAVSVGKSQKRKKNLCPSKVGTLPHINQTAVKSPDRPLSAALESGKFETVRIFEDRVGATLKSGDFFDTLNFIRCLKSQVMELNSYKREIQKDAGSISCTYK
jgi:hypothetical protein